MLVQRLSRSFEGATGGRPSRSGTRRTLRASVSHPTLPGRLRAPARRALRPASEQLRFGRSYVGDGPGSASWDSWGDPDSVKCRGRAPAGARPASLGARRPGVIACHPARHGCGHFPHQRLPALCPLVCEGTKKEAHPARFEALGPGAGPAEHWLFDIVKKRLVIPGRDRSGAKLPDFAALNPGYCSPRLRHPPYCVPTAPAALRIGVQRATSLLTSSASASGVRSLPSGSTLPRSSRRLRVAGSSSAFDSVSLSLATISLGVPLGANSAFQALTLYSGNPPSAVVGTSGSAGERCSVAIP